ncbi:MAG: hypothetical protein P4L86_25570, partial [Mycobacterium sp.]|nr:hypothetical protein [Mycobacterium sp.]
LWPEMWLRRHSRVPPRDVVSLLGLILDGVPHLDHPACARHPEVFDDPTDELVAPLAVAICNTACPSATRSTCLAWARSQPPGSLRGIIGGQLFRAPS